MTAEEIQAAVDRAAIDRGAWVAPPKPAQSPVQHVSSVVGCDPEHARVIAKAQGLVDDQGRIWCWDCGQREGLLPHLHCAQCRADAIARSRREAAQRQHPETRRWNAIGWQMSKGSLTREQAETLLINAQSLPSATDERMRDLQGRFNQRFFDERAKSSPSWATRGFRRSSTGTNDG